jgi:hypothetical protein
METLFTIIGILICILLSFVIVLYLAFAYQIYNVKKIDDKNNKVNEFEIINKKK